MSGDIAAPPPQRKYTLLNSLRIVWIGAAIAVCASEKDPAPLAVTLVFLGLASAWLALTELNLIQEIRYPRLAYLPTAVDLCIISFYLYYTGTVNSLMVIAYLYSVALSALNTEVRQGLFAVVFSGILYTTVCLLVLFKILPERNILGGGSAVTVRSAGLGIVLFWLASAGLYVLIQKLTRGNLLLIEELRRQASEALALRDSAESANRARRQFLANMSHEMRTPLNAIMGMTSLLRGTALDAEQTQYASTVSHSAEALLSLVNDVLDFSRIDAEKLTLEKAAVNLRSLLHECLATVMVPIQNKGLIHDLHINDDVPEWIETDPLRLRQILVNLLANAVKFTPPGGSVGLAVLSSRREDGEVQLQFSVQDSGIGMQPEDVARLFQPFEQLDASHARKFGGSGLGLAIAQRLVVLLGGTMSVDSAPEEGSIFRFDIKAKITRSAARSKAAPDLPPELRVLAVDDSEVNLDLTQRFLARAGLSCDAAMSGEEAVRMALETPYDVILMDVQMPEMDGLEAARRIRRGSAGRPVIIALTANAFEEDRKACLEAGMDDFLSKPVTQSTLYEVILRRVKRARLR